MMDRLRGFAILLMIVDHARDFSLSLSYSADDPTKASMLIFLTRLMSHVGAPIFIFLAGAAGAFVASRRGIDSARRFLIERGLVLILLEVTIIRFAWTFQFGPRVSELQAVWVIGLSMIGLALVMKMNRGAGFFLSLAAIFFHNMIDDKSILAQLNGNAWIESLFRLLHKPGLVVRLGESEILVLYPFIPWFPLMYLGFLWGERLVTGKGFSPMSHVKLGLVLLLLFLTFRIGIGYGEPKAFLGFSGSYQEALTVFRLSKYPPSLNFLLFAMGQLFLLAAVWSVTQPGPWLKRLEVFGRTAMFVYILHLFLVHSAGAVLAMIQLGPKLQNFNVMYDPPEGFGYPIYVAYVLGFAAILVCYPVCLWFDGVKARHPNSILRYL